MTTLQAVLNRANPNTDASAAQLVRLGDALAAAARTRRLTVDANVATLPNEAKAAQVLYAFAAAGTATGVLTPVDAFTTPAAGQIAVDANGNLEMAAADAITLLDVTYISVEGQVFTETVEVVANSGTLLSSKASAQLLAVNRDVGTATGPATIAARGSAPGAGSAALADDGLSVAFNAADAVTRATITYIAIPGVGDAATSVDANLRSQAPALV